MHHQSAVFENRDFADTRPFSDELHDCEFVDCNFSKADLSGLLLEDCSFQDCDLSMAALADSRLIDVTFADCKLLGVDFSTCSDFGFSVAFRDCNLRYASFADKEMPGTTFADSTLAQVDFNNTDLGEADLSNCRLDEALFSNTTLTGADLRGATNLTLDPEINRIQEAKLNLDALPGLLGKYELEIE